MAHSILHKRDVFAQVEAFLDTSGENYNYHKDKWNSFLDMVFCSPKVHWVNDKLKSDVAMAECVFEVVPQGKVIPLLTAPFQKLRLEFPLDAAPVEADEVTSARDGSGEQEAHKRRSYAQVVFQNLLKSHEFRPMPAIKDYGYAPVVRGDFHYGDHFSVLKARVLESDKVVADQYVRGGTQKHAPDIPAYVVVHRKRRKLGRVKMTADHYYQLNQVLGDIIHRRNERCKGDDIVCPQPRRDIVCQSRFAYLPQDDGNPAE